MRDVEPVLAAKGDEEVVACDPGDLFRLEAEQLADAVVLVDHVVACAQVGKRGERAADPVGRARRPLAEDLRLREEHQSELAPDEAAARGRDREAKCCITRKPIAFEQLGLDLPQHRLRAQRIALVRKRDDNAVALTDEGGELVLGLGEPARGERRSLRLEGERLVRRQRVELGDVLQRNRLVPLVLPGLAYLAELPDELGRTIERADKIPRNLNRGVVIGQRRLAEIDAALDRRVDHTVRDGAQRALGERREGADLLDLVAPELDPERLTAGRGEDVEDAAANGKSPSLVRALDPLVARKRELLGERVDRDLLAPSEANRPGPFARRRKQVGERRSRGAHEPAVREHVEGAKALADEVRGRLEAGTPAHTSAREQRNAAVAEEPTSRLGSVSGVRIVRKEADERTLERLVQGREHERQRRLGDAGAHRKRLEEAAEALVLGELADERVEDRAVHDERRNLGFRRSDIVAP